MQWGKAFRSSVHLKIHERIQRGEKLYNLCAECGIAFLSYVGFRRHIVVHSGDEHCNVNFVRKPLLFPVIF
jgi:hypothetical protein